MRALEPDQIRWDDYPPNTGVSPSDDTPGAEVCKSVLYEGGVAELLRLVAEKSEVAVVYTHAEVR